MSEHDECRRIAEEAVNTLCRIGCYGLHPSNQRKLWQYALNLNRQLHPDVPPVVVWDEDEGDIEPPRSQGKECTCRGDGCIYDER